MTTADRIDIIDEMTNLGYTFLGLYEMGTKPAFYTPPNKNDLRKVKIFDDWAAVEKFARRNAVLKQMVNTFCR